MDKREGSAREAKESLACTVSFSALLFNLAGWLMGETVDRTICA